MDNLLPIGVLDTGVGGLSVLNRALRILPDENYIYYGDSLNAPYGNRSQGEIRSLTEAAADVLLSEGIKALVIACNTMTSVAVEGLRKELTIPVIGMEPAVKPAIGCKGKGRVLVLATAATLKLPKFEELVMRLNAEDEIIPLPAPELAMLVEREEKDSIGTYLQSLMEPYIGSASSVVLGCTHYVFCSGIIASIIPGIPIIDGNAGTVLHLKNVLAGRGLLSQKGGSVKLMSSRLGDEAKFKIFLDRVDSILQP